MEQIKHKISEKNYYFLKKIQDYIDCEFIFFGSITRFDFLKNYSDIDIAIISDNIENTIVKIRQILDIPKIRKIYQKLPRTSSLVHGYKVNYDDIDNNLSLEIVLYDKKYKPLIMNNVNNNNNIPFYITYVLYILKLLYYKFNILSDDTLKYFKNILIGNYLGQELPNAIISIK